MTAVKKFRKIIFAYLILSTFLIIGCNSETQDNHTKLPETKPENFNFIFNYGYSEEMKNQLDTAKGEYVKDMIQEPSVTTGLKLTEEEMNDIYSEMKKIDILSYSEEFISKTESSVETKTSPYLSYDIKIMFDGEEKEVAWKDNEASETPEAIQLRNLFDKIQKYIVGKEEYKKLPEPNSAYQ